MDLDKLQERLIKLGQSLSPEQCKEFRDILDQFNFAYHDLADAYKMAVIELIPGKIQSTSPPQPTIPCKYTPAKSLTDITMALAQNLANQQKKKEGE